LLHWSKFVCLFLVFLEPHILGFLCRISSK